jgi:nucleoside-diphosphate-sugar epimerase
MQIFIVGATGVLGRRAVPLLIEAGHSVRAVSRSAAKSAQLRAAGAEPVEVSVFDPDGVRRALAGCEAVLHVATKIPPIAEARKRAAWAENDRLRTEGTRILVDAALAAGARLFLKETISFTYPDCGDALITEEMPLAKEVGWVQSAYDAEKEARRFAQSGGAAVILRFGAFHDASSEQTRSAVGLLRRRIAPVLGSPKGYWSIIHVADAARALICALAAPSGTYNVVDDEPLTRRAYAEAAAAALGLPPPRFAPSFVVKLIGGPGVRMLLRSQRVSNARLKAATGWAPRFPSARETWRDLAAALNQPT